MTNLASKVDNIEEFYHDVVLKFVSKLGNNNLRKLMGQVCLGLKNNPHYSKLNIDGEIMINLANLFGTKRSLFQEDYDFNAITESLVEACKNFDTYNPETREFFACNAIYWAKLDELSVRDKSLEFLELWMSKFDVSERSQILRYKKNILDTAVYYLKVHYGNEA